MPRKGSDSETVYRLWYMLSKIPRAPRKIDTATLERLLKAEEIDVTRRTIQRDLESLASHFHDLECDQRSKPYGWCWRDRTPMLDVPPMGLQSAVTFELVRAYLHDTLPRTTARALEPYFKRAREVLGSHDQAKMARWPKKVRVVPRGYSLIPPNVAPQVLDVVYGALLEERRFAAHYKKRGATEAREYEVSPLGMIVRDGALMLACTLWEYEDVNHLLLHRIVRAEPLDKTARIPRGFDLEAHIAEGEPGVRRGGTIRLKLKIDPYAGKTLHETPLSKDQTITTGDDGWEIVEATVPDTMELRGWIYSYAPVIEVLAPEALREEIAETARAVAERHG